MLGVSECSQEDQARALIRESAPFSSLVDLKCSHSLLLSDVQQRPSAYPPYAQIVSAGGQQVWIDALGVRDPHDLGGGVRMIESVPAHKLRALLLKTHQLDLNITKQTADVTMSGFMMQFLTAVKLGLKYK